MDNKFPKKTIRDVSLSDKTVLLRADYNLPMAKDGRIEDDYRIIQSLPTLNNLLEQNCRIVICSHLGRPKGKVVPSLSLKPVAEHLRKQLKRPVEFVPATTGDRVCQAVKHLNQGEVLLLENLRFDPREEANDPTFAKDLAADSLADYFVQDGFAVVHRAHATTDAITKYLPSIAGLLLEREYMVLTATVRNPKRPLVAILGGIKVSDKIKVVEKLMGVSDTLLIGGAMASSFLKFKHYNIGASLYEDGLDAQIAEIYRKAAAKVGSSQSVDDFIVLPEDVAVAGSLDPSERRTVVDINEVNDDEHILDIGPVTINHFTKRLQAAATVIWNGTLGYAELAQFAVGSAQIAAALADQPQTISVIGGGDTADFVLGWDPKKGSSFTHVSTGGGASFDLMAGESMPGIDALMDA